MIESGVKKEEYREKKEFYIKRLYDSSLLGTEDHFKHYDAVRFHKGYTNTTMTLECKGIRVGRGNPDWGAPTDKDVFIISLGKRIT